MTQCRIPEFCERFTKGIEIYDLKSKKIIPGSVKQKGICFYIH